MQSSITTGSPTAAARNRASAPDVTHPNKGKKRLTFCRNNLYSTLAQVFQQELMDIFRIDNSVADLDEKVDKRLVVPYAQTRDKTPRQNHRQLTHATVKSTERKKSVQQPQSLKPSKRASAKWNNDSSKRQQVVN